MDQNKKKKEVFDSEYFRFVRSEGRDGCEPAMPVSHKADVDHYIIIKHDFFTLDNLDKELYNELELRLCENYNDEHYKKKKKKKIIR